MNEIPDPCYPCGSCSTHGGGDFPPSELRRWNGEYPGWYCDDCIDDLVDDAIWTDGQMPMMPDEGDLREAGERAMEYVGAKLETETGWERRVVDAARDHREAWEGTGDWSQTHARLVKTVLG